MDQCVETLRTLIYLQATEEEDICEHIQGLTEEDVDKASALVKAAFRQALRCRGIYIPKARGLQIAQSLKQLGHNAGHPEAPSLREIDTRWAPPPQWQADPRTRAHQDALESIFGMRRTEVHEQKVEAQTVDMAHSISGFPPTVSALPSDLPPISALSSIFRILAAAACPKARWIVFSYECVNNTCFLHS